MFTSGPLFLEIWNRIFPREFKGDTFDPSLVTCDYLNLPGGTDSGKTVATMQVLTTIARRLKAPKEDPYITIVNKSVPDSKKGSYAKFNELVGNNQYVLDGIKDWNKTDRIVTWHTGWIMHFDGAIDLQSAKQGKRQILFCNEINGLTWAIFFEYIKRTRGIGIGDYNPNAPFFIHDKFLGPGGVPLQPDEVEMGLRIDQIISDHRHNPFLSQRDHDKTENIRDPDYWKVYARGMTGNLVGTVYPDWTEIPDSEFPWQDDKLFTGLDVGWTNDPTALVLCCIKGPSLFVHEMMYEPGVSASILKELLVAKQAHRGNLYSEHAIDMIKQLRKLGVTVIGARKGPGSVEAGIAKLKEYKVYYTASSSSLKEELKRYEWELDEETKRPTNTPKDSFNHLLDAIRYAVYTRFFRS